MTLPCGDSTSLKSHKMIASQNHRDSHRDKPPRAVMKKYTRPWDSRHLGALRNRPRKSPLWDVLLPHSIRLSSNHGVCDWFMQFSAGAVGQVGSYSKCPQAPQSEALYSVVTSIYTSIVHYISVHILCTDNGGFDLISAQWLVTDAGWRLNRAIKSSQGVKDPRGLLILIVPLRPTTVARAVSRGVMTRGVIKYLDAYSTLHKLSP